MDRTGYVIDAEIDLFILKMDKSYLVNLLKAIKNNFKHLVVRGVTKYDYSEYHKKYIEILGICGKLMTNYQKEDGFCAFPDMLSAFMNEQSWGFSHNSIDCLGDYVIAKLERIVSFNH
jgi:hypothetical protein